ncbi:undecaprenyl-diphosphate phosphatase [Kallotenue papyrolyticum]|uniref:undecaprenyl-diphosphate phosphatase n=1 Tax=Kallotenue papyrolyticum TaxID=1325125 RepID=UPI0004786035|nr:undecaprenyl-diphosphate phosphatase [Kallotenue papyrolyticum]
MHARLIATGVLGVAALGLAVYRAARRNATADDRQAATRPAPEARGTMPPQQPAHNQAKAMSTPLTTASPDRQATHPRRVPRWLLVAPPLALLGLIGVTALLPGDYRIASTLGIVQGLGEFLPISSSAHLILTPWLFGWNQRPAAFFNTLTYDVALHLGTLLALLGFFWRDWISLLRAAPRPRTPDGRLFWLIALASLPGAAIGFVLDSVAEDYFRDQYLVIAAALAVMGVILYLADRLGARRVELEGIGWGRALLIGLAQSLAFVPGVSRSGSTMTMGRALGLTRETAARFSFLMSAPITAGALLWKLKDVEPAVMTAVPFWLGIGMSFAVGVLAIGFLLRYLRSNSFLPFVIYRLALAALVVIVYIARG